MSTSTIAIISCRGIRGSFFSTCIQPDPVAIGDILIRYYNSEELAEKLINLGTSVLIAPKLDPDPSRPHTLSEPQEGVSQFLHRDGNLESCKVYDESEFEETALCYEEYYHYVFENGAWSLSVMKNGKKSPYKLVRRARLLITSKNGYPVAQISNIPLSFRVHTNCKRCVKAIDRDTVTVPVDYWYSFVEINKENFGLKNVGDIDVDERSINYYGFYTGDGRSFFRSRLTKNFINIFFNFYGAKLTRYEPNIDDSTNCLGMRLAEFESTILEYDSPITVGENATAEECTALLASCHPNSSAYRVISAHMETIGLSEEEKTRIEEDVNLYESELSEIFNKYKDQIEEFKASLPSRMFDCGFTIVYTVSTEMSKKYQQLISLGKRTDTSVNVNFPSDYSNCSNSFKILEELRRLSGKDILNTISVRTVLD